MLSFSMGTMWELWPAKAEKFRFFEAVHFRSSHRASGIKRSYVRGLTACIVFLPQF